jgi:hypothetical protein
MSKKSKILYANSINLVGLYSETPIKLSLTKDGDYYGDSGHYSIQPSTGNVTQFSSKSKREVEIWTRGALDAMNHMRKWCGE